MTDTEQVKFLPKPLSMELSWLSFNERVLQEAANESNPLIERLRFLGIFSNNMDEYYRVRVAAVRRRSALATGARKESANELLVKIRNRVLTLTNKFDTIFKTLKTELGKQNILMVNERELTADQGAFVESYFKKNLLHNLNPILIDDKSALPEFEDYAIYFAVKITLPEGFRYAVIDIPTRDTPRYVIIPRTKTVRKLGAVSGQRPTYSIISVDNMIRYCLASLVKGLMEFDTIEAFTFKLTRDAELTLDDGISQSMLVKVTNSLKRRQFADPIRMVYDAGMPEDLLDFLVKKLRLTTVYDSLMAGGRYHNSKDLMTFPNVGPRSFEFKSIAPLNNVQFDRYTSPFDAIKEQDILLYYPYHNYDYMINFLRLAAIDPQVKSISMSLYRVASNSKVVSSLINAVRNRKEVTVVVELTARFDEQANIAWAHQLTEAGVDVLFSPNGLKVHSKLLLINRIEGTRSRYYSHIGTGNFNEKTAKVYTDFSLFTHDQRIGKEVAQVFDYIRFPYKGFRYKHLLVSPVNVRSRLKALIQNEVDFALEGKPAEISIKCNNLVDDEMIECLYDASQKGVQIKAIVRGMTAIELPKSRVGKGSNFQIISIIGRYLEHPRLFIFGNNNDPRYFIGSTDLMARNLDNRVEVVTPVYQEHCKAMLRKTFELQWADNVQARIIDDKQRNQYRSHEGVRKVESQAAIARYLARLEKQALLKNESRESPTSAQ